MTNMTKPRIFVTRLIPEPPLQMIRQACEVEVWTEDTIPPIAEKITGLDGLLTYGHEPVTADMMDTAPNLKVIANMGVGYDHIDIRAATERGIPVGNTPDVLSETTADLTFAMMLAAARNVVQGDRFIRSGQWQKFNPNILWGMEVHGSTLGIIGMGRIGRAVARRARAFDMTVLYHKRSRDLEWEQKFEVQYVTLDDLLARSDFVSIMTPLTPETERMIGPREFARMKDTAIFINTARGAVVEPNALYEALRDGVIAAAGLDVFEEEPISPDDPLLTLDNVVLSPHLGSATVQTRTKMGMMAAENLLAGLKDQPLPYPTNPEVGHKG